MGTKYILIICKGQIYDHEPDIECSLGYVEVEQKLFTSTSIHATIYSIY